MPNAAAAAAAKQPEEEFIQPSHEGIILRTTRRRVARRAPGMHVLRDDTSHDLSFPIPRVLRGSTATLAAHRTNRFPRTNLVRASRRDLEHQPPTVVSKMSSSLLLPAEGDAAERQTAARKVSRECASRVDSVAPELTLDRQTRVKFAKWRGSPSTSSSSRGDAKRPGGGEGEGRLARGRERLEERSGVCNTLSRRTSERVCVRECATNERTNGGAAASVLQRARE